MPSFATFLGFGPRKTAADRAALAAALDAEARKAKKKNPEGASNSGDDNADEDEEDEDEEDEEDEKAKKAVRVRNALRAAGHRRGIAAERGRLATIMNGLDPDKAEMAVTLALDPKTADVPADQIRALVDAAPAPQASSGDRSAFGKVMDRIAAIAPGPSFGGGDTQGKGPSLSGQMAKMLKLPK
jgi:hypothetical protein